MGAEIHGVQISDLTDAQFSEIEDALYCHKMIFFRDQNMTLGDQVSFTLRFGEFGIDAYTSGVKGYDNVQPVIKEADAKVQFLFGSGWHTDSPFLETPPAISMLYGVRYSALRWRHDMVQFGACLPLPERHNETGYLRSAGTYVGGGCHQATATDRESQPRRGCFNF